VDVRLSPEQVALRDSAARVVDRLGPRTVAELDDATRVRQLDDAVVSSGWRELRTAEAGTRPWASAVEVAIVAEELGRGLADTPFLGPTLAADLRRLTGAPSAVGRETVALAADLSALARTPDGRPGVDALAVDARHATAALVLVGEPGDVTLGEVPLDGAAVGADLTRPARRVAPQPAKPVADQTRLLGTDDLTTWVALGLAATSADLVGVMRGAVRLACDYASARRQYGAAIGSFQAVQHLLADAFVATEGSRSVALHAAWAVDALPPPAALMAGATAKAYCARAARGVCETVIQVHGGIGHTWDCLAHVYLRRALLSTDVVGGVGVNLDRVLEGHGVGGRDGLR